jgi:hypothetical protein
MVELAAAMVGAIDRPHAVLQRDLGVLGAAEALQHELHVGELAFTRLKLSHEKRA